MAKYVNGVPLYRQEQTYQYNEIMINRVTMSRWIIQVAKEYFKPFCEMMKAQLITHPIIQADETPFLVTKDGRKAGSKSYMWVYRTNPAETEQKIVLYHYSQTRGHSNLAEYLKEYSGVIVCDGYQAYHKLENDNPEQYRIAGCWVHAKRKFSEVVKVTQNDENSKKTRVYKTAHKGVRMISKIYQEEKWSAQWITALRK